MSRNERPETVTVPVLETKRLRIRPLTYDDAPFIFELVNEPSWIRYIGDRGVRTLDDARGYIEKGPMKSYESNGFGLSLVELAGEATPVGICGLIRRDTLDAPDIGFAFSPRFWGRGYANEAADAVLRDGRERLALSRIVAITTVDNESSIRVLEKCGFTFDRIITMPGDATELKLWVRDL